MEIGARLKEARESRDISLEALQETTKIQKRYLQAIEKNEFDVLPGKFYTRAFIREYASAVGLDPEQIMEEHKNELPSFEDETSVQYSRVQKSKKEASQNRGGASRVLPTILTVGLIVGLIFVVWLFWQNGNSAEEDGSTPQAESNDEINVPEEDSADENAEESAGENTDTGSEQSNDEEETASDENSDQQTEESEDAEETPEDSMDIQLKQEGSGGFPQHVYDITGAEDEKVTIELTGTAYMEIQTPQGGENLVKPREYSAGDSPISVNAGDENELYIKTGNAPGTVVKINNQEIPFPNKELSTQKLLLKFKE